MIEPSFWETSRGIWLIVAISGTAAAVLGFWIGYELASTPQQISVHLDSPLIISPPGR